MESGNFWKIQDSWKRKKNRHSQSEKHNQLSLMEVRSNRKNLKTRMELVKTIIKMRLLPNAEKIVLRNQNRVLMEKKLVVIIPMAAKMKTTLPRIIRLIIQI